MNAEPPRTASETGGSDIEAYFATGTSASSLLSSRWPRDNLLTPDPSLLYSGRQLEPIALDRLDQLAVSLHRSHEILVSSVRMGLTTWDLNCTSRRGPVLIQVPRALDEPSAFGRSLSALPRLSAQHNKHFMGQGLKRYLVEPREELGPLHNIPILASPCDSTFRTLTFGAGRVRLDVVRGKSPYVATLGPNLTRDALVAIVAAIAYHYDAVSEGGTSIADFFVNDGDFVAKRCDDGSLALRLLTVRRLEANIQPSRLLLYLCQLMAYEDMEVAGTLLGIPTLMSNPSVAFAGLVKGRVFRALDLGADAEAARHEAASWIEQFGRSTAGLGYRVWTEAFLAGKLKPTFGDDLRERWWRLNSVRERRERATLSAKVNTEFEDSTAEEVVSRFLARLDREIGPRAQSEATRELLDINDLSFAELLALFSTVGETADHAKSIAHKWLRTWPHLSFDGMLSDVPQAKRLRKCRSRLDFGAFVAADDEPLWLERSPAKPRALGPSHIANAEAFDARLVPAEQVLEALQVFQSFESFMDAALHDERWGYYSHHVQIGRGGHFTTSPERLSPEYGKWVCQLAFDTYGALRQEGQLGAEDVFPVIEFGAGTGRLAGDFLAAAELDTPPHGEDRELWQQFRAALAYRIYEKSESLRRLQLKALGARAQVLPGDARTPHATLARDFPDGLVGFIVTNEVPDAFGVHKVLLLPDGRSYAALVALRLTEAGLVRASSVLQGRIAQGSQEIRRSLPFLQNWQHDVTDHYLSQELFTELLSEWSQLSANERESAGLELRVSEAYVPALNFAGMGQHFAQNAVAYATGLAAEDTAVIVYPNLHADRFVSELGRGLRAGLIVTIDYGSDTETLIHGARRGDFPFRIYFDGDRFAPQPNNPYARIGLQDLTADVNFSALANSGLTAGLELVHYGPERDVAAPFLRQLWRQLSDSRIFEFLSTPVFKVLLLGTPGLGFKLAPLVTPLPLTIQAPSSDDGRSGTDARIAQIQQTLLGGHDSRR